MHSAVSSPLGAHAFIWSPVWDRAGARLAASGAHSAGFDLIEIPLLNPRAVDTAETVELLDGLGLGRSCSLCLPAAAHLPAAPEQAFEFLSLAIEVTAELGSEWLTGALYGHLGTVTGSPPTIEELATIARVIRRVAARAADHGIKLGLEVICRYETYLLNTVEHALDLIDAIGASNVYVHLDTYHMNIEEASFTDAISRLGDRLGYVHLAESHRGALGSGHVPFDEVFDSLTRLGYGGPIVIESFLNADPAIKAATATWNDRPQDPARFLSMSLETITSLQPALAR